MSVHHPQFGIISVFEGEISRGKFAVQIASIEGP